MELLNSIRMAPTCFLSPKAEGRLIKGKGGRGVFAVQPIGKDEILAIWGGEVITGYDIVALPEEKRRLILQVDENHYLLTTNEGPADWINHSCDPNSGLRGQITLVAMRDIAPGEEICFDYVMSDSSIYDEFQCGCTSPQCRGKFSADDWMKPELWDRYRGYFSPYLERRIQKLGNGIFKK